MTQAQALNILKTGRNVYLTGPAGSGKTHVLREYIKYLRDHGVEVGLTASTGIAATHFGGVTIHSWSGIGIRESLTLMEIEEMLEKEYLWKRFSKTKVLIIDEISMLPPKMFDSLEQLCRAVKQNEKPFGGMQIVLSGDFYQLPPVSKGDSNVSFAYTGEAWRKSDIRVCYLDEQYRQSKSDALQAILQEMRDGKVSQKTKKLLLSQNVKDFGEILPTKLFTHNSDVDALNEEQLDALPNDAFEFRMEVSGKSNVVEALKKGILAPETLRLKKEAIVMFVKNNFEVGYVNGTLGVVTDFREGVPVVKTFSGDIIFAHKAEWVVEDGQKVLARATQVPLRLAWAITVHKSQGMTLDAAEIDLSKSFVSGQGYVALSRLRSLDGLLLRGFNEMALEVSPNVVRLDKILKNESAKWSKVISRFSDKDLKKMHEKFILESGGTLDQEEIKKNKEHKAGKEKISTLDETADLVKKELSLKEIAEKRKMTLGTILSHLEKLKESGSDIDFSYLKPKASDLKKIKTAFGKSKDMKLSPVFKKLKGEYSFEDLRLARLFL